MSNEKKQRTVEEIQKDYTSACVRAGHTQYQINQLSKDLGLLNDTMRDLNLEANEAQAKASVAAPVEAKGASDVA